MNQKEFVEDVLPCMVLNMDEVTECLLFFHGISMTKQSKRHKLRGIESGISIPSLQFRANQSTKLPKHRIVTDVLEVSVNQAVDLIGVRLFGLDDAEYKITLNINGKSNLVSLQSSGKMTESMKYVEFTVHLVKPVRLDPDTYHRISAFIEGPTLFYPKPQCKLAVAVDNDSKVFYNDSIGKYRSLCGQLDNEDVFFPTLVFKKVYDILGIEQCSEP